VYESGPFGPHVRKILARLVPAHIGIGSTSTPQHTEVLGSDRVVVSSGSSVPAVVTPGRSTLLRQRQR
jgi:hypothetical protein